MWSPTTLRRHRARFFGGWMSRLRDKERNPSAIIAQRLGPWDLLNILRVEQPNVWEWLALEGARPPEHGHLLQAGGQRRGDRRDAPVDTSLSRDGRFVDDRAPGTSLAVEPLWTTLTGWRRCSPRSTTPSISRARSCTPARAPKVCFDRAKHLLSFAKRMQRDTLPRPSPRHPRTGWRVTTGWDHGVDARRGDLRCPALASSLQECGSWGATQHREDDARGRREGCATLDGLGIPIRRSPRAGGRGLPREERRRQRRRGHQHRAVLGSGQGRAP